MTKAKWILICLVIWVSSSCKSGANSNQPRTIKASVGITVILKFISGSVGLILLSSCKEIAPIRK